MISELQELADRVESLSDAESLAGHFDRAMKDSNRRPELVDPLGPLKQQTGTDSGPLQGASKGVAK